jgi:hypothetical protein
VLWLVLTTVAVVVLVALLSRYSVLRSGDSDSGLEGWRQVAAEDFDSDVPLGGVTGSSYAQQLFFYQGYSDTFGHGQYEPDKVLSVKDGNLDWYLHSDEGVGNVAAAVVKIPATGWGQLYGRYTVRFRSDVVPGYKIAFLLWPDSDNWGEGEIDFPEAHSLDQGQELVANMYRKGDTAAGKPGDSTGFDTGVGAADTGWHEATIEWLPSSLTFILDGKKVGTKTEGVPDTPMHWVLQVETSEEGPKAAPGDSGHVQVDWVKAYSRE